MVIWGITVHAATNAPFSSSIVCGCAGLTDFLRIAHNTSIGEKSGEVPVQSTIVSTLSSGQSSFVCDV
jgi:hypothetical protein